MAAENLIEVPNKGEGDSKTITGANTKATADNLIIPAEAITIIIITEIIKAQVDVAVVVIITEVMATIEAIIGYNTYQYHQYYKHDDGSQVEQYGLPCTLCSGFRRSLKHCFKGEHDINNLMEKMSLG